MSRTASTIIDLEKCIGCGECIKVCPAGTISMVNGKAAATGNYSMHCGHCEAVCPTHAVKVTKIDDATIDFKNFAIDHRWLPHGKYDTGSLVQLMLSRRSCRNYTEKSVDRSILEDLVKIGITAPSGTNSQKWTFTLLPSRNAVIALGERVAMFFERLNRLAEKSYLRYLLKLVGKPQLDTYYRRYFSYIKDVLKLWRRDGSDLLFHGATAAILVGSKIRGASCPREDALLATQNILLAAHSMGLGTCLIGFVLHAIQKDKSIQKFAGIPDDETVYAVIALGYPDETYQRNVGRKKTIQRFAD